ncbi:hybrid sensor histidine kinase/response regulator [Roseateles cellulosilyticus]|uniref:histidine kinase n=1 Tax=Pelomonas cellulosilytica TaxID=2906762 RepID=A0ABS8XY97_9BURK|nr:hybrid sensor histidine kinase/response regulator [Pelomonas sp. P8]
MSAPPSADVARILIVDDLPENLLALQALLSEDRVRVHTAQSGQEALSLLLEHEFALALLDVQMPGMSGFELAELIRGSSRTRHLPIVFVSAADRDQGYTFRGYENGAVDFLYKPLDAHAVRSKVRVFTELHAQSRELQRQLVELEAARAEQQRLVDALQQTQAELQRALKMRDEFMSMVSHELRTPLGVMSLEAIMRQQRLDRGDVAWFTPERLQAMVDKDTRQVRSMTRLIEDLLDIARLQHGRLSIRPQPTNLGDLAQRVVADFESQFQQGDRPVLLTLKAQPDIVGEWDDSRVAQVLVNLLSNALRYGEGKPVEVEAGLAEDGLARLAVRDQGMGIPAADQDRIFQQFERLPTAGRSPGMGLGLYISQQFVKAHGGRITVCSQPGQGACFEVLLPLTPR